MIKTLKNLLKQDKERYSVPRKVQDIIPIQRIWKDDIFQVGNRFSKTYKFSDINYLVASREDKEAMFLAYSELLNSLDSGATTKITINNRRLNKANFEQSILMPMRGDSRDVYRKEYNQMLLDKATGANGIIQEKYITISVAKKDIEEARPCGRRPDFPLCRPRLKVYGNARRRKAACASRLLPSGRGSRLSFRPAGYDEKGTRFQGLYLPRFH